LRGAAKLRNDNGARFGKEKCGGVLKHTQHMAFLLQGAVPVVKSLFVAALLVVALSAAVAGVRANDPSGTLAPMTEAFMPVIYFAMIAAAVQTANVQSALGKSSGGMKTTYAKAITGFLTAAGLNLAAFSAVMVASEMVIALINSAGLKMQQSPHRLLAL